MANKRQAVRLTSAVPAISAIPVQPVGDVEACSLRPGNVHSADGWRNCSEPVVMRYKERKVRRHDDPQDIRISRSRGIIYVIRLKANAILQRNIAHLLTRPVGRPPDHVRRFHALQRQAGSWREAPCRGQSGVAPRRALFASVSSSLICRAVPSGWWRSIITVARRSSTSRKASRFNWTRLSCRKFRNNAVRLQLHALAYNLGNFMRIVSTGR